MCGACVFAYVGQSLLDKAVDGGLQGDGEVVGLLYVEGDCQGRVVNSVIVEQVLQGRNKVPLAVWVAEMRCCGAVR